MWMGSVGKELHHLEKERAIQTDPEETRRRRTIQLVRKDADKGSWGFTLQTYGIRNKRSKQVEVMTYVDYVEMRGPAWIAGMRRGDVLLSVNGESVEGLNHPRLVAKIQESKDTLRLVVLFEDCCRKVELYERFIKLKRILSQKMRDLRHLEHEERILSSGGQLSRVGLFRDSIRSTTSSDWDCYSELASPGVLDTVAPNQRVWRQCFFTQSTDTLDRTNELSYEYSSPFSSSRESLSGASQESLSLKDVSSDVAEKVSELSNGAEQSNGACGVDPGDSVSVSVKTTFRIGAGGDGDGAVSETETPTLRRFEEETQTASCPGSRKRSNSTLLNDMRMKLIADIVSTEAREATKEICEGSCGYSAAESEATVEVCEDVDPCRLYKGVRINDSDEVTRL